MIAVRVSTVKAVTGAMIAKAVGDCSPLFDAMPLDGSRSRASPEGSLRRANLAERIQRCELGERSNESRTRAL